MYYSSAVPTREAAKVVKEIVGSEEQLLEVGCGNGYWARFLRLNGINVIATDIAIGANGKTNQWHPSFLPRWIDDIHELDGLQAVTRFEPKYLFCCYPPAHKCEWLI